MSISLVAADEGKKIKRNYSHEFNEFNEFSRRTASRSYSTKLAEFVQFVSVVVVQGSVPIEL